MNIMPIVTVTLEVNITLTQKEAQEFLVEPNGVQAQVRQLLAEHAQKSRNGKSATGGQGITLGKKDKPTPKGLSGTRHVCPNCKRSFTSAKYLSRHQQKAHPDTARVETN